MRAPLPWIPPTLLDAGGRPRLGAWSGAPPRFAAPRGGGTLARLRTRAREKRWIYVFVASREAMLGAAIVEAGFFGGAFLWVLDRARGLMVADRSAAGLPRRNARVEGGFADAAAWFEGGGLALELRRDGARWTIRAEARRLALDAALDSPAATAPFTLCAPVPGAGPRVTTKAGGLPASGAVRAAGATLALDGGSGGVDATAGLLARETAWRWAFASGRDASGAPVAFNLCAGFGLAADDPGENARLAPAPARLPPVAFVFEAAAPLAPWRVASADAGGVGPRRALLGGEGAPEPPRKHGAVALGFRPVALHREVRRLGLVSTRFVQVAGTFDGALPGADGAPSVVAGLPGVVEDHWARW